MPFKLAPGVLSMPVTGAVPGADDDDAAVAVECSTEFKKELVDEDTGAALSARSLSSLMKESLLFDPIAATFPPLLLLELLPLPRLFFVTMLFLRLVREVSGPNRRVSSPPSCFTVLNSRLPTGRTTMKRGREGKNEEGEGNDTIIKVEV